MSNSPLVSYTKISPHNGGRRTHAIDRITPHCVVGQCVIEALGAEFSGTKKKSSNYGIDRDGRVGMFVAEDCRALTSSSSANDNRAVTIECASDATQPCAFRDVVYDRLVELCTDICRRNGKRWLIWIPNQEEALAYEPAEGEMLLTVHRWFAATGCPGDWLMARMMDLATAVTARLAPAPWYTEAMAWAKARGLINDGRPNDPVTRAELATVLYRIFGPEDNKKDSGLLSD